MSVINKDEGWREVRLQHTVAVPGFRSLWDTIRRRSPVLFVRVELKMMVRGSQATRFTVTSTPWRDRLSRI